VNQKYDLVGIGNPVYDTIETPYISTKGRVLSGCSTNACIVATRLGLKTCLVGSVGGDFVHNFNKKIKEIGIDSITNECKQSGGFHLVYDSKGDRTLTILGIADKIPPGLIKNNKKILDSRFILFGPILQEIPLEVVDFVKENSKAKLFLDPQGFVRGKEGKKIIKKCDKKKMRSIISNFDVVKPNEYESELITGFSDPKKSAEELYSWGAKIAIVTLAERGSVIYDGLEFYKIPAYKTLAKDPTGAGDTYAGGFMTELLRNKNLYETGLFASATASIWIEYTGPDAPVSEDEVRRRIAVMKNY